MFVSKITARYISAPDEMINQGDILKDIAFVCGESEKEEFEETKLSFAVVMSQACDLSSDFLARKSLDEKKKDTNNDKYLPTVLVCPAYDVEKFARGEHRSDWIMETMGSKVVKKIKKNDTYPRYHYLADSDSPAVPELIIDFKHFYTLPTELVYSLKKDKYLATANELFRERLSQRFANYLSRFGLPELFCKPEDCDSENNKEVAN
jgi:hypothetical protein